MKMTAERMKYLRLLGENYPTQEALCTEISRLNARLSLPKGTEHFMSDIHGEYEAFCHIMNNCSGVIREKVHDCLGSCLTADGEDDLCTLIYYPEVILRQRRRSDSTSDKWYQDQAEYMIRLARMLSSKYTRVKVRSLMPESWAFLIDELMYDRSETTEASTGQEENRLIYHQAIIDGLIQTGGIDSFLPAVAALIKNLAVSRLHVVGDIYDRGPRADSVMEILMRQHTVDIEWGNHDILWMGAASGSECCVAAVLRNSISYGNTDILERGYGIPLRALTLFAEKQYPDMPLDKATVHAVNIIMFKLEGQLVQRNPDLQMEDRLLLHRIDRERKELEIDGQVWPIRDLPLSTVDPDHPYELTPEEEQVVSGLRHAFRHSPRLHEHIDFLYKNGQIYRSHNGNLLYHGCVPLNADGTFLSKTFHGKPYSGKAFMDYADRVARRAYYSGDREALDFMWYLWCGTDSPLCGRKITTFARVFIEDKAAWKEPQNPYYEWYNSEEKCREILEEFGLTDPASVIVNGHTPVRVTHGESPLRAGGRLVIIDGGFCRAYQKTTGIAGYTLIANSRCMRLMSHQPFTSLKDAQETGRDIHSQSFEFVVWPERKYVRDTDHGKQLRERMEDLLELLDACRDGTIHLQNES